MAKVNVIERIELMLDMEEAEQLEGLLLAAVEFDSNPLLSGIYAAIAPVTSTDIPDFKYNNDSGFFEKEET